MRSCRVSIFLFYSDDERERSRYDSSSRETMGPAACQYPKPNHIESVEQVAKRVHGDVVGRGS